MEAVVARWPSSGDTQAAFAARHGISRTKLRYWLRRAGAADGASAVAFAPVQVVTTGHAGAEAAIEIVMGTGERVVIRSGASAELLRLVLSVLRPC